MKTLKILSAVAVLYLCVSSAGAAEAWTQFYVLGNGAAVPKDDEIRRFYINPTNLSDTGYVSVAEAVNAFDFGAAYWSDVTGSRLEVVSAGVRQFDCGDNDDHISGVCFAESIAEPCQVATGACSVVAVNFTMIEGVWIESTIWIQLKPEGVAKNIVAHEVGHGGIGLAHTPFGQIESIMGFISPESWSKVMSGIALPYDEAVARHFFAEPVVKYGENGIIQIPCVLHGENKQYRSATLQLLFDENGDPDEWKIIGAPFRSAPVAGELCSRFNGQELNLDIEFEENGAKVVVEVENTLLYVQDVLTLRIDDYSFVE